MTAPAHDRFLALVGEHERILLKIASSYCRDAEDRRDLVQEMVVQLWRAFDRYDEAYRFSTWMYRVAMNVAISFYRSETRRVRDLVPVDASHLAIGSEPELSDELRQLHDFIRRLDPLDRALIVLYLDGNSYDEIAAILGISTTNVATKIGRIKQKLRRDHGPR